MNFFAKDAALDWFYGNLPHWRQDTVCYFVTFRTADSIPQSKLKHWLQTRDLWLKANPEPRTDEQTDEYHKLFSNRLEYWLDCSYGECLLAETALKEIVVKSLAHFHNTRYQLYEFAVAANHVHLLIEPINGNELSMIMHSIKSFTANEINKAKGRTGQFWQKEYFDHILRSEDQYRKIVKYIQNHDKRGAKL